MFDSLKECLSHNGKLPFLLKNFEERKEQTELACDVLTALNEHKIALIEAGTGIGKSLAYVLAAFLWAEKTNKRVVIATHTIALQDQLYIKDIPLAQQLLDIDVSYQVAVGMGNYLCLRKLANEQMAPSLFQGTAEQEESLAIEKWSRYTKNGLKSDLGFIPSQHAQQTLFADPHSCFGNECTQFASCFFFKKKRALYDARLIITNHHLLFSDLKVRMQNPQGGILPDYDAIIIDEAHHIEDVAQKQLAETFTHRDLDILLNTLRMQKAAFASPLSRLLLKPTICTAEIKTHIHKIEFVISHIEAIRARLTFLEQQFIAPCINQNKEREEAIFSFRITAQHENHPAWHELKKNYKELIQSLKELLATLVVCEQALDQKKDHQEQEFIKSIRFDLRAHSSRLTQICDLLSNFFSDIPLKSAIVRFIEMTDREQTPSFSLATHDVSEILDKALFKPDLPVVLVSATLTQAKSFIMTKKRLGIEEKDSVIERCYTSPFNFEKNSLFITPSDMSSPDTVDYQQKLPKQILAFLETTTGGSFVLFTSYKMMRECFTLLKEQLISRGYTPFIQGENERSKLIQHFKQTKRAVLFGTSSFWEGIDVIGDALSLVIITKLPFEVPTNPIVEAQTEWLKAQGAVPFMEYFLPKAVVKFVQAFGRLIRHRNDFGCVVCLDTRVFAKSYGKIFLKSLPECPKYFEKTEQACERMKAFYKAFKKSTSLQAEFEKFQTPILVSANVKRTDTDAKTSI